MKNIQFVTKCEPDKWYRRAPQYTCPEPSSKFRAETKTPVTYFPELVLFALKFFGLLYSDGVCQEEDSPIYILTVGIVDAALIRQRCERTPAVAAHGRARAPFRVRPRVSRRPGLDGLASDCLYKYKTQPPML
ncbi:hypothetical protein EVAR_29540_1 [Eumeta japonica]|uniref:Uncharacterized protein n=1 Tax=Eumeta variegata TaxID=151549 RepID=A0A4C1WIF9_EUMVA|nr:hypothetical protein EVAR_29540_1 [Eumeta japonica]